MVECAYCGSTKAYPKDIELRNDKLVCRTVTACDAADAAHDDEEES